MIGKEVEVELNKVGQGIYPISDESIKSTTSGNNTLIAGVAWLHSSLSLYSFFMVKGGGKHKTMKCCLT